MSDNNISWKPDSEPILENGTGTPYLAIFDGSGNPIIDPLNNLPIGIFVTDFVYNYDEEDGDDGEFTIHTNNPDIIAMNQFRDYMPLKLQWGWIFPSKPPFIGPVRSVIKTDHDITFGQDGVKITIKFSDNSIILKNSLANYDNVEGGFIDWLTDIANGLPRNTVILNYDENRVVREELIAQKVVTNKGIRELYNEGKILQNTQKDK